MKETRKHFEKISDDMDSACSRNSQAPRSKPQECEDAYNLMMANKSCFAHTSLDYVYQVGMENNIRNHAPEIMPDSVSWDQPEY